MNFDLSPLIGAHPGERITFSLDEGPTYLQDISVDCLCGDLHFTRIQGGVLVQGTIETRIQNECVRCLDAFLADTVLEVEEIIGLGGRPRPDVTYHITDEGWFDAEPLLREQAWVAIPINPICRPECRGLCAQCGANLNREECECSAQPVNPHFSKLASLLSEVQE